MARNTEQAVTPRPEGGPLFDEVQVDQGTLFLVPKLEAEEEIALLWREAKRPDIDDENIISLLPLDRLGKKSVVYVLVRKIIRGRVDAPKAVAPVSGQHEGTFEYTRRPDAELIEEVELRGPVRAEDHWEQGASKFQSKLIRRSFLGALQLLVSPYTFAWEDGNARKSDDLPTLLYLRGA